MVLPLQAYRSCRHALNCSISVRICSVCLDMRISGVDATDVMMARSRSKSAGISRGSAPDLRRIVDLHNMPTTQHDAPPMPMHCTAVTTTTSSANTACSTATETLPNPSSTDVLDLQPTYNGVLSTTRHQHHHHHQQQQQQHEMQLTDMANEVRRSSSVTFDDVFKIAQHVPVCSSSSTHHPPQPRFSCMPTARNYYTEAAGT